MLKQRKKLLFFASGVGLCALLIGGGVSVLRWSLLANRPQSATMSPASGDATPDAIAVKQINSLKSLPPEKRTARLETLVRKERDSQARNRARYLLATEQLQQGQPQKAIEQLQGLETDYPVMAAQVMLKRAKALEQMGDGQAAEATRQELLKQQPTNPATAEALVDLGRNDPKYWDQAIAQFPSHPKTLEIVQQRLQKNPNQPDLLLMVARHGLYLSGYTDYLDRLTQQYASRLTPADWEAIGFGYWEKQLYGKAGMAYAKAPYTAHTAYRTGRGMQLGNLPGAVAAYQRLVNDFPKAEETSLGLIRMAQMLDPQPAIAALDQVISRYPDRAAQALLEKSRLLDKLNNKTAAAQARQTLLSRYSQSDAAAELRWSLAQEQAEAGNLQAAKTWAEPILKQNPDSEYAPEAGFWLGKWASQLGKHKDAQLAYEAVLSQYPESYYAWRSAAMLGWTVGDFMTVRELNPAVERPAVRPELPVGSATLRELYQLGQDRDAWALWQTEFQNPMQPTVAEQFTDGIMRLGVGDYLDGIFMVSYLSQREDQQDRQQYHQLKQQRSYWQALYPFPFLEPIEQFSQERQLNPLLVTALIRQESRFMPGIQSSAGAVGLMQVMPDTGAWVAKNIQLKEYKLNDPEDNIKLGTWYLDYTHTEFSGNSMLAIASYNAGPGAVLDWVAQKGITDPDQFVEAIPYDETRGYVKSVFANYWNYLRLYNPEISQKLAQVSQHHPSDQGS